MGKSNMEIILHFFFLVIQFSGSFLQIIFSMLHFVYFSYSNKNKTKVHLCKEKCGCNKNVTKFSFFT